MWLKASQCGASLPECLYCIYTASSSTYTARLKKKKMGWKGMLFLFETVSHGGFAHAVRKNRK